jgi:cardiolipin synthase
MEFITFLADTLREWWPHIITVTSLVLMVVASAHVVMYKKDTRAAIGWIGVVLLSPIFGALVYSVLGINRVQRRAVNLRGGKAQHVTHGTDHACDRDAVCRCLPPHAQHLAHLERLIGQLTERPLLGGNKITPLVGGQEAYPKMLEAIDRAERSVAMCSYIFDNDRAGQEFSAALSAAVKRGVEVRVMIDSIGARYSFPSIVGRLQKGGVRVARFLPTYLPGRFAYSNLRSHRKILVADGRVGFTGGLNIREGHDVRLHPHDPILDHHFHIEGPVVGHLQEVFAEDWAFCTDELLDGEIWFPELKPAGTALARGISAGPDSDLDKRRLTLEGALSCAETSVCVVTPYFLPDASLVGALNVAALRGVEVDIILPEANNLTLVKWATNAMLWQVLERGCRVWMSPPPFDHTKLMLVDRAWTLLGSGNWDPRSLRLNFEFDVECYEPELAAPLHSWMMDKRQHARPLTLGDMDGRSLPVKLRDGVARLLTPYL